MPAPDDSDATRRAIDQLDAAPAAPDDDQLRAAPARKPPTTGGLDELLDAPPPGAPPGGLDGYRAGRWLRLGMISVIVTGVLATAWWLVDDRKQRDAADAAPTMPSYTLLPEVDPSARARRLVWSEGPARLGLSRQEPGVEEIVLPDRRLVLAPGHDIAQVKLEVKDGATVALKVLVGEVVQLPPLPEEAAAGSPPAPTATAP
jgi:hypothetical protein